MEIYENTALARALAYAGMLLDYDEPDVFQFAGYEFEVEKTSDYETPLNRYVTGIALCDRSGKYNALDVWKLERLTESIMDRIGEESEDGEPIFDVPLNDGTTAKARKQDYILQSYDGSCWRNIAVFPRSTRGYRAAYEAMRERGCLNMQVIQYS